MLPYLFEIFGYKVPSYGFFIAMGLIACGATFLLLIKKKGMPESVFDNYFNAALFAILGGFRLHYSRVFITAKQRANLSLVA